MSLARGIILGGDMGKLIVEASDREVAEFAKGQLVEVQSKGPKPTIPGRYFYGPAWVDFSPPQGLPDVSGSLSGVWDEQNAAELAIGSYLYDSHGLRVGAVAAFEGGGSWLRVARL